MLHFSIELNQSKIVKYADNTVIFLADKDYGKIEEALFSNMNRLSKWFTENENNASIKVLSQV